MTDIFDLNYDELFEWTTSAGLPRYRMDQIFAWSGRNINSIDEMTDISLELREKLKENFYISNPKIKYKASSKFDETIKYLIEFNDQNCAEAVIMKYRYGYTICISTQIGCNMGCKFCASTIGGKVRNLSAGEILKQVLLIQKDLSYRISNIVLMGTGEPLDNFKHVMNFIKNVTHPKCLNIGNRHISISTCGLVDEIYKLIESKIPVSLSISLHAPDDETRNKIMPINKVHNLKKLMKACRDYISETNKRISFQYIMIKNLNDTEYHLKELKKSLKNILCYVNLIPANRVYELDFERSDDPTIQHFYESLNKAGIRTTIRRELGKDINGACGQLRRESKLKRKG